MDRELTELDVLKPLPKDRPSRALNGRIEPFDNFDCCNPPASPEEEILEDGKVQMFDLPVRIWRMGILDFEEQKYSWLLKNEESVWLAVVYLSSPKIGEPLVRNVVKPISLFKPRMDLPLIAHA